MIVLCSTVGRGYSLNKLFSENGRYYSVRRRGRPRKGWMDGVKDILERKRFNIQEVKVSVQDRSERRSICRVVV